MIAAGNLWHWKVILTSEKSKLESETVCGWMRRWIRCGSSGQVVTSEEVSKTFKAMSSTRTSPALETTKTKKWKSDIRFSQHVKAIATYLAGVFLLFVIYHLGMYKNWGRKCWHPIVGQMLQHQWGLVTPQDIKGSKPSKQCPAIWQLASNGDCEEMVEEEYGLLRRTLTC